MGKIVLVLGGVRSGKSRFAQQLAAKLAGDNVLFVATAEAGDDEMLERIEHHRQDRPSAWTTIEVPRGVGQAIAKQDQLPPTIIIDCLTLLVSNVLLHSTQSSEPETTDHQVDDEVASLLDVCRDTPATVIIVSGEVGMGIVPENELARRFRDLLGRANQQFAEHATSVYWMCAGLAVNVQASADSVEQAAARLTS
jgi:adenosylcobinamide kinase/adenosylcobinamide-phosphate guanylyltransferase